jgi:oligopeptide transport system substrate-binding protein
MGEALEALYGEEADAIAPQLARHFDEAGMPKKAIPYLLSMGDRARLAYAHEEAVGAYRQAVALQKEQNDWDGAARTLMMLGLAHHNAFDFRAARQAYDEAFSLRLRAARTAETPAAPAPHPFRFAFPAPNTLDPAHYWASDVAIPILFSGLVRTTAEMGVEPEIARRWEVLDGGRKYLFHLRDDWCWSDGVPVTAGDFEFAWKRHLDPNTGAIYPHLLYDIESARGFHQGQHADPSQVGVRALDDVTLLVQLEGPTGYFLHLLHQPACLPVPQHAVETYGDSWTEIENLVTNGPFRLTAWRPGEFILFSHDPAYAGRLRGNLQQVKVILSREGGRVARLAAYEAGSMDYLALNPIPTGERARLRQGHAREHSSASDLSTAFVHFDTSRPPFHDHRVRRAFALALDREKVVEILGGGHHVPATGGFVPPEVPGHSPGIGLSFDPEGARQLLAEAGYPDGRDFPAVLARTWSPRYFMCEHFLACWRESLGITIELQNVDHQRFEESIRTNPPHLVFGGWEADYLDPDSFLRVGVDSLRRTHPWPHAAYDELVEKARRLMNQGERMKLYRQADKILMQEAYVVPTFYGRADFLVKPWVKYPAAPLGWWALRDIVIQPY